MVYRRSIRRRKPFGEKPITRPKPQTEDEAMLQCSICKKETCPAALNGWDPDKYHSGEMDSSSTVF